MPGLNCYTGAMRDAHAHGFTHTYGDTHSIAHTNTVGNSEPYGNTNLHAHAVRQRDNPKRWIRDQQLPTVGHS
jgi:hypothetical protein